VFALSILAFGHVPGSVLSAVRAARAVLQLPLPEGTAFNVTEKS